MLTGYSVVIGCARLVGSYMVAGHRSVYRGRGIHGSDESWAGRLETLRAEGGEVAVVDDMADREHIRIATGGVSGRAVGRRRRRFCTFRGLRLLPASPTPPAGALLCSRRSRPTRSEWS